MKAKNLFNILCGIAYIDLHIPAFKLAEANSASAFWKANEQSGADWIQGFITRCAKLILCLPMAASIQRLAKLISGIITIFVDNLREVLGRQEYLSH